ncbi:NAD dependent epimerase/dehydratase family protein [Rhodobacteraceae bacterium THAF1]|uniref:polysaccharide biosynthesis C-terminal domain-containing protein n=1 Tax=Palleronia sp. THAF1 TaxID=2587842 RepID=UPI000F3D206C|nr:NAD-dependent epimerase/dehydratase family protein [Palleronia sp. THAF1]QFU10077.1 NAD dependent epimerase/dehydratase family protein [Palleronia sp. THAF1]VDC17018.1 NAD dependent epimerase/dehydratase family protein [Rhodobacteraceae bacterium THAF1]
MRRIVVTGAAGLIGWHAQARLHAANCAASFHGDEKPYDIIALNRSAYNNDAILRNALIGADAVLHFAGVNRAPDDDVETQNPAIAHRLLAACRESGATPHIVYANSTHSTSNTPYGRGKRHAGDVLSNGPGGYTDLVLPHIFGEGARPFYNNVTATLIHQILAEETPDLNPDGRVSLVHAGDAAQAAIDAALIGTSGRVAPEGREIGVPALFEKLTAFHASYLANIVPDVSDPFDLALFNSYRAASYPERWPRPMKLNTDARGTLFEAVKGGGGGQTFLSTTKPGITRGNHFHLHKVERFLVVQGEAVIRVRRVLDEEMWEYRVSGDAPAAVDMPTLHTHSIENIGDTDLLTLFWTHDLFNPATPDTYADKVLA